jgi:molybdopterin-containing oxidoreductase family iron-sulfur binding subunit
VSEKDKSPGRSESGLSRREFLAAAATGAAAVSGMGGIAAFLAGCSKPQREEFLQKRFTELSPQELQAVLARLEKQYAAQYDVAIKVGANPPLDGVLYGYGLDISRCIGCRRCVYGCVKENNQSRDPQIHWIKVLQMRKDKGVDVMEADAYYDPPMVPEEDYFYFPVQCQHCRRPPCVVVCPVKATWQEPDGIVVTDYNWCIGCRCCMSACPYGARHLTWSQPKLPKEDINPNTHYLGNRPRDHGVVEKCTFCIQRVRDPAGRYPACVEACPVGARKFGNLLDENSEIRYIMRHKRVLVFKEELNTQPKFFYFYAT